MDPDTKETDWWPITFLVVGIIWTAFDLTRGQWGWAVLGSTLVAFAVLELQSKKDES